MADISVLYGEDLEGKKRGCLNLMAFCERSGRHALDNTGVLATFKNGKLHREDGPDWEEEGKLAWALNGKVLAIDDHGAKYAASGPKGRGALSAVASINFAKLGFKDLTPAGWKKGEQPGLRLVRNGG